MIKKIIKILLFILLCGIMLCIVTAVRIYSFGAHAKPKKSDTIIVLGCSVYGTVPSPFLKWRCDEGLRLYNQGFGKCIIVSGGMGPGEDIREAEAMKIYLIGKGMDSSKILLEDKSTSTMSNLTNSKKVMQENGLKSAVIVSNKYHLLRASSMTKLVGIESSFSGVFVTPYKNHEYLGFLREIPAYLKFILIDR